MFTNAVTMHEYLPLVNPVTHEYSNVPPLFGTNMQLQNEFHPNNYSCFDWTKDVTMAKGGELPP